MALFPLLLAGCSGCPAPQQNVAAPRQTAAEIDYQPFAAVITSTSAEPRQEALKALSVQLTTELLKIGTLPEDSQSLPPGVFPEGQPWLRGLECRAGQALERALKPILEQRPYVAITPADVDWLKQAFEPEALDTRMNAIAATLDALPADSVERRRLQHDPLDVLEHARAKLKVRPHTAPAPFTTDPDGFFVSADGRTALVFGFAALPRANPQFKAIFRAACERAKARTLAALLARAKTGAVLNGFSIQFVNSAMVDSGTASAPADAFQRSLAPLRVVIEASDEPRAIAAAAQVRARLIGLVESGELAPLATVLDLIPSESVQQVNFASLRSFDFVAALKAFQAAASKRFGTPGLVFFKPFLQRFEKFGLLTREPQTLSWRDALAGPLQTELAPHLQLEADDTLRRTLWYFPKAGAARDSVILELERALAGSWPAGVTVRVSQGP